MTAAGEKGWEIEIAGRRLLLSPAGMTLGRDPDCEIPIDDVRVSWRHLSVEIENGSPMLTDLGSSNGTFVDGKKLGDRPTRVVRDTTIQLGSTRGRLRVSSATGTAGRRFRRMAVRRKTIQIGRAPDNDIVLDEPNVSWHHAEVRAGDPVSLADLGSRNGTRLGNQLLVGSAGPPLDRVPAGIGPFSIVLEGGELVVADERAGTRLNAEGVSVQVNGHTILHPTGLNIVPGEFVALIGPSGS